jgi:hypothetical protein
MAKAISPHAIGSCAIAKYTTGTPMAAKTSHSINVKDRAVLRSRSNILRETFGENQAYARPPIAWNDTDPIVLLAGDARKPLRNL